MQRILICLVVVFASLLMATFDCPAQQVQDFPSRRITLIVPVPPSSSADLIYRILGEQMQRLLNQPVVIEDRPGGGGLIGMQAVLKAPADGYTLFASSTTQSATSVFVKNGDIDAEKDFVTIAVTGYTPYFIVVTGSLPVKNMRDLVAYAKANPRKLNMGMQSGTWVNLSSMEMMHKFGIEMTLVPYAGGAFATQAMLANDIQVYMAATTFGMEEHLKTGRLRVLAVTDSKRFPQLPDIPTVGSQLGTDLINVTYLALQARTGTPQPVLDKLASVVNEIYSTTDIGERLRKLGMEPYVLPQDQAQKLVLSKYRQAREVAKAVGLPPPQ